VYPGIATDRDIEERRQSIATEKRCDNQLKLRTKADYVRCGGGERNKAAGHPSDGNGNGNGDGDRRQALGGWWRRIRWQRKWDFAVENYSVMAEYNFSDLSKLAPKVWYFFRDLCTRK
jgi:hypothetical protein